MKIEKAKYNISLTEEEKKAILTVMELSDVLYDENVCDNKECEKCPLYNGFCVARVSDGAKIQIFLDKLENFLNGN